MKTAFKISVIALAVLSAASCISLDTPPYDRETDLTYWEEDPDAAINAVNTCYNTIISMEELMYADTYSDNAYMLPQVGNTNAIGNGSFSTADDYVEAVWDSRYSGIRICNELLNNIDRVPSLDPTLKNRYIAEAMVIRAFHYYELYTRFGDVPYTESVLTIAESQTIARTPRQEVVNHILSDLDEVIDNGWLPESYSGNDLGRLTIWAAMAIKAKVQLFEGEWEDVRDITSEIMSGGGYELFPSYSGLFEIGNENNSEVILDAQYMPVSRESRTQYYILPPSFGGYAMISPLQELVDNYIMLDGRTIEEAGADYDEYSPFEGRDPRLAATITDINGYYTLADGTQQNLNPASDAIDVQSGATPTGYYFRKYWDNTYRAELYSGLNPIVIRYADILLMNAEALAELGQLDAAAWDATVRKIRERAGFTLFSALDFPGGSQSDLVQTVRRERRSELAFEGLRHKDIVRWQIAEDVMDGWCHGMKTDAAIGTDNGFKRIEQRTFDPGKHYLWPIPQADRDLNSNLTQNPEW